MTLSRRTQLLFLAAVCFWLPSHMESPREANHKLLVATSKLKGSPFESSVVFVVRHNGYGALGFVLNKPAARPADPVPGGPLQRDAVYTLHSMDYVGESTSALEGLSDVGLTEGEDFPRSIGKASRKPSEYIRDHIWWTTQPMEDPERREHLFQVIEWIGWDKLLFATDYPHWDFDEPSRVLPPGVSDANREAFYLGNAKKLYGIA